MSGTVGILYVFTCSSSCLIVAASRLPLIALMPWRCSCCVRGVSFRCFLVAPLVIKQPRGRTAVCWTSHASVFVGFGVSYRRYRLFGDSMFSFRLVASRQSVYGRPCRGWFSRGGGDRRWRSFVLVVLRRNTAVRRSELRLRLSVAFFRLGGMRECSVCFFLTRAFVDGRLLLTVFESFGSVGRGRGSVCADVVSLSTSATAPTPG